MSLVNTLPLCLCDVLLGKSCFLMPLFFSLKYNSRPTFDITYLAYWILFTFPSSRHHCDFCILKPVFFHWSLQAFHFLIGCTSVAISFSLLFIRLVPPFSMSLSTLASSETSSQRSTSFDDISSDGTHPEQVNPTPQVTGQCPNICLYLHGQRNSLFLPVFEPLRPRVPSRRCRMNMDVTVDLEALLPDGIQDLRTGQPVVNLDFYLYHIHPASRPHCGLHQTGYPGP